jgi:hypothetical protein
MKKHMLKFSLLGLLAVVLITGCKKDKGETNEEEVITTMELTFTPVGAGSPVTFTYDDPDGPGGNAPTQSVINLNASSTYTVSLKLLNKTVTPTEDITTEVNDEANAHRFYFVPTAGSNITVSNLNKDGNGFDLGTTSTWATGAAGTGQVKVVLRHYPADPPNKAAADPIDSPKSGTDIEVTFATTVL